MATFGRTINGATAGMSKLAQALIGGDSTQQAAADHEMDRRTKMAQALAQIDSLGAAATAHNAQAALHSAETDVLKRRPDIARTVIAATAGVDGPTLDGYLQKLNTGTAPTVPMGPPDENGGMGAGSMQFEPATASRMSQALARLLPTLNAAKDIKPDDYAKALGEYRSMDLGDQVLSGQRTAGDVGRAQAAAGGKALFKIAEGYTGDLFSGASDMSNPVNSAQFGFIGAKTKEQQAAATDRYASARSHDAAAGKYKAETDQINGAPKGVLVQTDAGPVFADPRTGQSVPVIGPDGKPAQAKLKDIPPAQNTAIIENAKALANLDDVIAEVARTTGIQLDANGKAVRVAGAKPTSPNAVGGMNYIPEAIRQRTDPEGVPLRAKIANIAGQRFHDLSGAAVSVGEAARLVPFIPSDKDGPGAVLQKLANLRREYQLMQDQLGGFYSPENGYKAPPKIAPRPAVNGQRTVSVDY